MAFFLVDPAVPVLSTADMPLLRPECLVAVLWQCEAFRVLPIELIELIVARVPGLVTREQANAHRNELMQKRKSANERLNGRFDYSIKPDFSLCEH